MSHNDQLLDSILAYVKQRYLPDRLRKAAALTHWTTADLRFFAKGAALVSESFTSERSALPRNYFNRPEYRSGYLLYFVAANLPKVAHCLRLVNPAQRFAGKSVVRMLDLGCGPGTAALAAAHLWRTQSPPQTLAITGVDQNREILKDAQALFAAQRFANATLTTHTAAVRANTLAATCRHERFDVIVCANLLNEIGDLADRERLTRALLQRLTPEGVLILIEPALQKTTRELMMLRDGLLGVATPGNEGRPSAGGGLGRGTRDERHRPHVLAPCLHHAACPMLRHNKRDWCHAYLDWRRPKVIADLDQLIGNKKEYLKFSYLILSSRPSSLVPRPSEPEASGRPSLFRVVSAPLRTNGKCEWLLCPADGQDTSRLFRLVRLDKHRSPANATLDRVLRGDLIAVRTMQIGTQDRVTILQSFRDPAPETR